MTYHVTIGVAASQPQDIGKYFSFSHIELANNGCLYDMMNSMGMLNPFGKTHFTTSDKKHPLTALPTLR